LCLNYIFYVQIIKGTAEERGLTKWQSHQPTAVDTDDTPEHQNNPNVGLDDHCETYDIPIITRWLKRYDDDDDIQI